MLWGGPRIDTRANAGRFTFFTLGAMCAGAGSNLQTVASKSNDKYARPPPPARLPPALRPLIPAVGGGSRRAVHIFLSTRRGRRVRRTSAHFSVYSCDVVKDGLLCLLLRRMQTAFGPPCPLLKKISRPIGVVFGPSSLFEGPYAQQYGRGGRRNAIRHFFFGCTLSPML